MAVEADAPMIELSGVSKRYGGRAALQAMDLAITRERTTVLIGPSGCGKSTTLRLIIGLIEADAEAGRLIMDTFYGDSKVIYFNGEPIEIIHVPSAHTDGDSIVFFRGSDVVSAGGIISTRSFPSFDPSQGGTVNGLIDALNRILDITVAETRGQGGTIVIPGHGRLYDEADVAEYRDMLTIIRDRVANAIDEGISLRQLKERRPTLEYDGVFDAGAGPWTSDTFIEAVYRSLSGAQ